MNASNLVSKELDKHSIDLSMRWIIGPLIILIIIALSVSIFSKPSEMTEVTQYLGMITLVAVGIERFMEGLWTIIDASGKSSWPINLTSRFTQLTSSINSDVSPVISKIEDTLKIVSDSQTMAKKELEETKKDLTFLRNKIKALEDISPDTKQLVQITQIAAQSIDEIEKKYPDLDLALNESRKIIDDVSSFVDSIKDNPGRRLISLFSGSILGLIIAGFLGLDVFMAALGVELSSTSFLPSWRVALTGILIGLGSSPTHEVIRAIQEFKNSHKA